VHYNQSGISKSVAFGLVILLFLPSVSIAQNFDQLMAAIDKIETGLRELIANESTARNKQFKNLQIELAKLKESRPWSFDDSRLASIENEMGRLSKQVELMSQRQDGEFEFSQSDLVTVINDIEFLKSENAYLRSLLNNNTKQLASIGLDENPFASREAGTPKTDHAPGGDADAGSVLDARSRLEDKGVSFEFVYTGELVSNTSGGIANRSEYLENGDVLLSIDAEKLMEWPGASFSFYVIGDRGGNPTEIIGDLQGTSNIESDDTWKIYEAWYQQDLWEGKLSFLVGLYDLNSEFDAIQTAGFFLNSSFGIGPDYSQSGHNGPSIFPNTSLSVRARVQPTNSFYIQTALFDGVPGDPSKPTGTHIKFGHRDGVLLSTEVGYVTGASEDSDAPYSKYALGTWIYTAKHDDISAVDVSGEPILRSGNGGFYLLGEQTVYREQDASQGLAMFARLGFANAKINQLGSYFGAGLMYSGLIPGRNEDQFGVAVAAALNGGQFRDAQFAAGTSVDKAEVTLEFGYKSQILPQLAIQPDSQYVINPGTDPGL